MLIEFRVVVMNVQERNLHWSLGEPYLFEFSLERIERAVALQDVVFVVHERR